MSLPCAQMIAYLGILGITSLRPDAEIVLMHCASFSMNRDALFGMLAG